MNVCFSLQNKNNDNFIWLRINLAAGKKIFSKFFQNFSWSKKRKDPELTSSIFSTIVPCPLSIQNSRAILLKEYRIY